MWFFWDSTIVGTEQERDLKQQVRKQAQETGILDVNLGFIRTSISFS